MESINELKRKILKLTSDYSKKAHKAFRPDGDDLRMVWEEGMSIPYAGRVFTEEEVVAAVSSTLDFWLTLGTEGHNMEKELASSEKTFLFEYLPKNTIIWINNSSLFLDIKKLIMNPT